MAAAYGGIDELIIDPVGEPRSRFIFMKAWFLLDGQPEAVIRSARGRT